MCQRARQCSSPLVNYSKNTSYQTHLSSSFFPSYHGVSRSATLIISYLIRKYEITAENALFKMKKIRPAVQPNEGFMSQLRLYHILMRHNKLNSIVSRSYFLSTAAIKIS